MRCRGCAKARASEARPYCLGCEVRAPHWILARAAAGLRRDNLVRCPCCLEGMDVTGPCLACRGVVLDGEATVLVLRYVGEVAGG